MIGRAWAANLWSFAMADDILYPELHSNSNRYKNGLA